MPIRSNENLVKLGCQTSVFRKLKRILSFQEILQLICISLLSVGENSEIDFCEKMSLFPC